MSSLNGQVPMDVSSLFDQDYGSSLEMTHPDRFDAPLFDINSLIHDHSHDVFHSPDPLKNVHKFSFKPLSIDFDNTHFVKPHQVHGYIRNDGVAVDGYFRDGDGNTSINRTFEQGGGYFRSNPDGIEWNNLKK